MPNQKCAPICWGDPSWNNVTAESTHLQCQIRVEFKLNSRLCASLHSSPFCSLFLLPAFVLPPVCVFFFVFFSLYSPTKASLYGAILFTMQEAHWLPVSKSTLILIFTLFMATSKVRSAIQWLNSEPSTSVNTSALCQNTLFCFVGLMKHVLYYTNQGLWEIHN